MSIYIFKTEEFYGGKTQVFTNKEHADTYLAEFLTLTGGKIDAVIEEHKPVPSTFNSQSDWQISMDLVREDGWSRPLENVRWTPIDPTF